jgi:hypothetical protein
MLHFNDYSNHRSMPPLLLRYGGSVCGSAVTSCAVPLTFNDCRLPSISLITLLLRACYSLMPVPSTVQFTHSYTAAASHLKHCSAAQLGAWLLLEGSPALDVEAAVLNAVS